MKINVNQNCPNKNCLGGVITYNGSTGTICKKCNPNKTISRKSVINQYIT